MNCKCCKDKHKPTPIKTGTSRLEVCHSGSSVSVTAYLSDEHFLRAFDMDTIEEALKRYHIRFKRYYRHVIYHSESGWYWLVRNIDTESPEYTLTRHKSGGYEFP